MRHNHDCGEVRLVFATNLNRLMNEAKAIRDARGSGRGLEAVSGVADSAISRYRRAAAAIDIEQLGRLAAAFNLQAWHLLIPDLDPKHPPINPRNAEDRELYKLLQAGAALLARHESGLDAPEIKAPAYAGPYDRRSTDSQVSSPRSQRKQRQN